MFLVDETTTVDAKFTNDPGKKLNDPLDKNKVNTTLQVNNEYGVVVVATKDVHSMRNYFIFTQKLFGPIYLRIIDH